MKNNIIKKIIAGTGLLTLVTIAGISNADTIYAAANNTSTDRIAFVNMENVSYKMSGKYIGYGECPAKADISPCYKLEITSIADEYKGYKYIYIKSNSFKRPEDFIRPLTTGEELTVWCDYGMAGMNNYEIIAQDTLYCGAADITQAFRTDNVLSTGSDEFIINNGTLKKYTGSIEKGKEIVLPDTVKSIAKGAFDMRMYTDSEYIPEDWRKTYMKLLIPENVKVDEGAFDNCISLAITYEKDVSDIVDVNPAKGVECKVYLPENLKEIKHHTFNSTSFCDRHKVRVYLNKKLEKIGSNSLKGVVIDKKIPESVKEIGDSAFSATCFVDENVVMPGSDNDLRVPVLPANLKKIGKYAFAYQNVRYKVDTITVPASVKYIAPGAFTNESGETELKVKVVDKNRNYSSDKNGWLYSKDKSVLYHALLMPGKNVINQKVRKIVKNVFIAGESVGNKTVKIVFPKNLEKISRYMGRIYDAKYVFNGKKAPVVFGDNNREYNYLKMFGKNKKVSIKVPKGCKKEYIKKLHVPEKYQKNVK